MLYQHFLAISGVYIIPLRLNIFPTGLLLHFCLFPNNLWCLSQWVGSFCGTCKKKISIRLILQKLLIIGIKLKSWGGISNFIWNIYIPADFPLNLFPITCPWIMEKYTPRQYKPRICWILVLGSLFDCQIVAGKMCVAHIFFIILFVLSSKNYTKFHQLLE